MMMKKMIMMQFMLILMIIMLLSASGNSNSNNFNAHSNVNDFDVKKTHQLYYRLPYGSMYGPFTSLQIYQWWEQGHLDNDTMVSVDGQDEWTRVDSYFKHNHFETHSHVYIPNERNSNEIIDRQELKQQDESAYGDDVNTNNSDQYQYQGYDSTEQNIGQYPNQYNHQYNGQEYNQYQYTNQNQNPDQYTNQNQNPDQYPNQNQNSDQYTNQNQNPDQYTNQNQNSDQYTNQNQNPDQYPNQYSNQYPDQYRHHYPNHYSSDGRGLALRTVASWKEKVKFFSKKTSDLLGTLKEKAISTALSTTDRVLDMSSSISVEKVSSMLSRQKSYEGHSSAPDIKANDGAYDNNDWNTHDGSLEQNNQPNNVENSLNGDSNYNDSTIWDDQPDTADRKGADNWDTNEYALGEKDNFLPEVKLPSLSIPSFSSTEENDDNTDFRDNISFDLNDKYQDEIDDKNNPKKLDIDNKDFKFSVKSLGVSDRDWLEVDSDKYLKPSTRFVANVIGTALYPLSFILNRFFPYIISLGYANVMSILPTVFPELLLYFIVLTTQETLKPINIILGISFLRYLSSSEVSKLSQFAMFSDSLSSDYIKIDPIPEVMGSSIPAILSRLIKYFPQSAIKNSLKQVVSIYNNFRELIASNSMGVAFMITSISYILIWTIAIPALGDLVSIKLDGNQSGRTSSHQWDFLTTSSSMLSPFGWMLSLCALTLLLQDTFSFNTRLLFIAASAFAVIEMFSIKKDNLQSESSTNKISDDKSYVTYLDNVLGSNKLEDIKRWGLFHCVNTIKTRQSQRSKKQVTLRSNRGIIRIMRQSLTTLALAIMTVLAISRDDKFIERLCDSSKNLNLSFENGILNNIAKVTIPFINSVITDACNTNSNVLSLMLMVAPMYLWVEFLSKSNLNRKASKRIEDFLEGAVSSQSVHSKEDLENSSGWSIDGPNKELGIQMENVSVEGEDDNPLIADTTIYFEPGKINIIIAQIPKKSSIFSLFWGDSNLRLTKGKVSVHGRDLRDWNRNSLRTRMNYLRDKEPELSLEAGVLSGLQPTATGKELNDQIRALDLSGARKILNSLPQGPMTLIRNNEEPIVSSVSLTHDQWRCLCLSRALCNLDKDIVLLDSPCNQMSEAEEKEFYLKVRQLLRPDQVLVTTSSKFSSAYNADYIVILDKNKISQGSLNTPSMLDTIKENLPFI